MKGKNHPDDIRFYLNNIKKENFTIALLKPDLIERGLDKEVIGIILENGFDIVYQGRVFADDKFINAFYADVVDKPYFKEYKDSIFEKELIVLLLIKPDATEENPAYKQWRDLMGATKPEEQAPNTIRKKYALNITLNSVHGSDSYESANKEAMILSVKFPRLMFVRE